MSLKNLLEKKLVSCEPKTPIQTVAGMMDEHNVGSVLVTDGGAPVGIVTDRDIVIRCISRKLECAVTPVKDIMTKPVQTVSADAGLFDVIRLMKRNEIRRVPVVDDDGLAVGLVSFGDVFQLLGNEISDLLGPTAPEEPKIVEQAA